MGSATIDRRITHGQYGTPAYISWKRMISRTTDVRDKNYNRYGERGIAPGKEWRKFAGFYWDMGPIPLPGLTLDRIDVNEGYRRDNCRWATSIVQNRNRRDNRVVTLFGRELMLDDLAKMSGVSHGTIHKRIYDLGYDLLDAATRPPRSKDTNPWSWTPTAAETDRMAVRLKRWCDAMGMPLPAAIVGYRHGETGHKALSNGLRRLADVQRTEAEDAAIQAQADAALTQWRDAHPARPSEHHEQAEMAA